MATSTVHASTSTGNAVKRMGLREANQHFSRAIAAIRRGQEVVLTDRGRPIAVLRPIAAAQSLAEREIERLVGAGILIPPASSAPLARFEPRPVRGERLSRTLSRQREDRF